MSHWRINISEWGILWGLGTEKQAEEWRRHKCRWEGCIGQKRPATEDEIENNKFESLSKLLGESLDNLRFALSALDRARGGK